MPEHQVDAVTLQTVQNLWRDRWGLPIVSVTQSYSPEDVEGLALRGAAGALLGLITWAQRGDEAEIVTIDALLTKRGYGSRLLRAAEEELARRGVARVWLITTNDNLRAFTFYLHRGYRLVRVHLDAMERVRHLKPEVPDVSIDGLPLQDVWELEKKL